MIKEFEEKYLQLSPAVRIQVLNAYAKEDSELCQDCVGNELVNEMLNFDKKEKEGVMAEKIIKEEIKKEEVIVGEVATGRALALPETNKSVMVRKEFNLDELEKTVKYLYASGYFKDLQSIAQAMAKAQYGQELGFPPYYSLIHLYMTPGKPPSTDGQAMAALIRNRGYDFRGESNNQIATITIFGKKGEKLGTASFTIQEANAITFGESNKPLTSKKVWKDYTSDMLWWRAMSRCARRYAPDAISGVYYYEEVDESPAGEGQVESDISAFKVENKQVKDTPQPSAEKSRKDILQELVKKFGNDKIKEVKTKLKIESKLLGIDDSQWAEFIKKLQVIENPKEEKVEKDTVAEDKEKIDKEKEKEKDKEKKELTREEKLAKLEELKEKFGTKLLKEVKEELDYEGKLADLSEKKFLKFVKEVEKNKEEK